MRRLIPLLSVLAALSSVSAQDKEPTGTNVIDDYFAARWKDAGLTSAEPAGDAELLRRLTLDVLGRLPAPDEVRTFLDDKAADKRSRAVDRLLAAEEHAEYISDIWLDALVDHSVTTQDYARAHFGSLRSWLRKACYEDVPYPAFVRALVADRGGRMERPAVNYSLKHLGTEQTPVKIAVMNARLFLGIDIRCAQCHDHPFDKMTQEQFWGFANFMRPLRNRGSLIEIGLVYEGDPRPDIGEMFVKPKFLDGQDPAEGQPLGDELARFILATPEQLHARALVERIWQLLFSRKLLDVKKRGHRELVGRLAKEFVERGQSMRKLFATILKSRVYQMSSAGGEEARREYAVGPLKIMNAQQYYSVFTDVFDLEDAHKEMYRRLYESPKAGEQFKDPQVMRMMMFGWTQDLLFPKGKTPEDTPATATVRMAMKFMNNKRVLSMMKWQWGTLKKVIDRKSKPGDRIEELFLATLSRRPTKSEKSKFVEHVTEAHDNSAYEDVLWVIVNSAEFLVIH